MNEWRWTVGRRRRRKGGRAAKVKESVESVSQLGAKARKVRTETCVLWRRRFGLPLVDGHAFPWLSIIWG